MKIAQILKFTLAGSVFVCLVALSTAHSASQTKPQQKAYINSNEKAYVAMQALPVNKPIYMLNMIRFNDLAQYKEGNEFAVKGWSGLQAYTEYSRYSSPIAERVGGKVVYLGEAQLTLIGPEHERWDAIFIVSYPNLKSFLALVQDPEYKKHAFHRSAAVADSRLIRMASPETSQ